MSSEEHRSDDFGRDHSAGRCVAGNAPIREVVDKCVLVAVRSWIQLIGPWFFEPQQELVLRHNLGI